MTLPFRSTVLQIQFDYDFGTLFFKEPVQSQSTNLNPLVIALVAALAARGGVEEDPGQRFGRLQRDIVPHAVQDTDAAVGQEPIDEEGGEDRHGDGGRLQDDGREEGEDLRIGAEDGFHPGLIEGGEGDGSQREGAAAEDERHGDHLVADEAAVGGDAESLVEGDFEGLEDAVGGEEEHEERGPLEGSALIGDFANAERDVVAELAGEVLTKGGVDGLFGGRPAEGVAAERDHDDHEGEEGEQDVGGDGEAKDVDLGFHEVGEGAFDLRPEADGIELQHIQISEHGLMTIHSGRNQ